MTTKSTEDKEAERAVVIRDFAKRYAPIPHLTIWAMATKKFPGIHPAEVYRAVAMDPELSFDGRTSIVSIRTKTNKEA